jgi:hypothetical protein
MAHRTNRFGDSLFGMHHSFEISDSHGWHVGLVGDDTEKTETHKFIIFSFFLVSFFVENVRDDM